MAITFHRAAEKGLNSWEALKKADLITAFDFDMQESPEILQGVVQGYSDPLIQQFIYEAAVGKGSLSSDQVRWYEHGRIQNSYIDSVTATAWAAGECDLDFSAEPNFDIKTGQTLMVGDKTGGYINEVRVMSVDKTAKTATVHAREATPAPMDSSAGLTVIHVASEYGQGSTIENETVSRTGIWRSNKPIIIRDNISYDRSKIKQIVLFDDDMTRYAIDDKAFETVWENAQLMAGVFGKSSEAGSALETDGLLGSESVTEIVAKRGNTAQGNWSDKSDLENYVKIMNSNKAPKTNMLLLNIAGAFDFDNALASISPNATGEYNFGAFPEGLNYRKLGFSGVNLLGWDTMYKTWDILDDETYIGAFAGSADAIEGISIPKGQVQMADGSTIPYLQFLYRDGMTKEVAVTGTVIGNDHTDELRQSYTTEFAVRLASAKDFISFY
jgi:hypothetical protein